MKQERKGSNTKRERIYVQSPNNILQKQKQPKKYTHPNPNPNLSLDPKPS
jgi:hypothetical protein